MKGWVPSGEGPKPSLTRCANVARSFFGDLTVENPGRELAWSPLPLRPPWRPPPRRTPASAELPLSEWPLLGRAIGLPVPSVQLVPEARCEWAPNARMAVLLCSG